jgi:methionyl-tRNA formyltransferase
MPPSVFVLGTFDQDVEALFAIELMRCLDEAGVPPAGVIYKRSAAARNPAAPHLTADSLGRARLHVADFNAPESVSRIAALKPDLLVYAGGRDLLRRPLLETATHGCLGGHYGRLPAIRGMGTVEWSVIAGEAPSVAIQRISPGIDTGEIMMQAKVPLKPGDTFVAIRDRSYFITKVMLALAARRLLLDGIAGVQQAPHDGRQYYRMHPALLDYANRALARMLNAAAPATVR